MTQHCQTTFKVARDGEKGNFVYDTCHFGVSPTNEIALVAMYDKCMRQCAALADGFV